jgi:sortase A
MEQRTGFYRSRTRRRLGRLALALVGLVLILGAVGVVVGDVRTAGDEAASAAPKDETMRLTVPKMKRVKNVPVYNAPATDKAALHDGTLHVEGTGFPWQEEANVYIAGHRLGYPRTDSFLVFYDLNKLKNGDKVVLRDTEDRKYIYRVFHRKVVPPDAKKVLKPVAGKNVVTLQTCTLPNYTKRLLIQAELEKVRTKPRPVQASAAKAG